MMVACPSSSTTKRTCTGSWLEGKMQKYATIRGIEVAIVLITVSDLSSFLTRRNRQVFFQSAIWGC